jgi:hypothetical protein
MTTQTIEEITFLTDRLAEQLTKIEEQIHRLQGFTYTPDRWHVKPRRKFLALDCGGSGAFLIDRITGELYNIKAYGVPDYNKKAKVDLGNIATVNPVTLHAKRWNYLR